LYGDVGDGPVFVKSYDEGGSLAFLGVYTPLVGPSVILSIDQNYRDTLVRENIAYSLERGFEYAGVSQMSTAPIQPPVLFGEDGSIAFVQIDRDPETDQPMAQVIVRNNRDFFDFDSVSVIQTLTPPLPVEVSDDGTLVAPTLLSYTTAPQDFNAGVVEFELPSGEVLVASAAGIALAANDAPPVEIEITSAPDGDDVFTARLGELVLPLDVPGTYHYSTSFDDGLRRLYLTTDSNENARYDWLTLVTLQPLKATTLLTWGGTYGSSTDPILEGAGAVTPDGTKVIFNAYSDELGASLWMIDLLTPPPDGYDPSWDGPWIPEPFLVDSGLPFIADAGNFGLPQFTEVTDEGFSIETFPYEGEGEVRSYTFAEIASSSEE
ncbi:MAG: hypothetical protein MUF38_11785, partial [Anaerolineae bacterium]|nr:hypothetical protein [Anaerolineae bacterium]